MLQNYSFFLNNASFTYFICIFFAYLRKKQYLCSMYFNVLKSKIHRVLVTEANLEYIGSIPIDEDLMEAANIYAGERVQMMDNTNGARIETYVIPGKCGSGCFLYC